MGLNIKQRAFIKGITHGLNGTESAKMAGYKNPAVLASRMMHNSKIIAVLECKGLTDEFMVRHIKKNIKAGTGVKATADTSMRGLELLAELKGYKTKDIESSDNSTTNIYINELKTLDEKTLQNKLKDIINDVKQLKISDAEIVSDS